MNGYQQAEALLERIRDQAPSGSLDKLCDDLSVLCRAYMEPDGLPAPPASVTAKLSPNELAVVNVLYARKGQLVPKSSLMDAMYYRRGGNEPGAKIADVMICKVRKRLEGSGLRLETIWGRGYRMVDCEPGKELEPIRPGSSNSGRFIPKGEPHGNWASA